MTAPRAILAGGAPVDRSLLRGQLERLGWRVTATRDPEVAVYLSAHRRPDVVLLGDRPGALGIGEIVRRIRLGELDRVPPVPVLTFTGEGGAAAGRLASCGADDLLELPLPTVRLAARLGQWLSGDDGGHGGVVAALVRLLEDTTSAPIQPSMR